MAGTLLSTMLSFTGLTVGVPSVQIHGFNLNGTPLVPTVIAADANGFTITADATNVTVTRTSSAADGDVDLLLKYWFTEGLDSFLPFVVYSGGDNSEAVVFDDSVAGTNSNIRENRATNRSPIDNTKSQITNLGSQDGTIDSGATGATANAATISGGDDNSASSDYSTVGGGAGNKATGLGSTVSGGGGDVADDGQNVAGGINATIPGGGGNQASGDYSHAVGLQNTASGGSSTAAGSNNVAGGTASSVGGGLANQATADFSTVAGGKENEASGVNSAIPGGLQGEAPRTGQHAFSSGIPGGDVGDSQTSFVTMYGSTPGSGVGESVELTLGETPVPFGFENGKGYIVEITAIARGVISAAMKVQGFKLIYAIRQDGGVATIAGNGASDQFGDAAANSWTFAATIGAGPTRLVLTFTTGATQSQTLLTAKVEFTEIN